MNSNINLPLNLKRKLRKNLSLIRLAKTGFFKKADIPHPSIARELNLNRAVLDKALIDLFSTQEETRMDVEEWLDLKNPDFLLACERSLLNPEGVYEAFVIIKSILRGKNARFNGFGTKNKKNT